MKWLSGVFLHHQHWHLCLCWCSYLALCWFPLQLEFNNVQIPLSRKKKSKFWHLQLRSWKTWVQCAKKNPQRNIIDSSSNLIIFLLFLGGWGREGVDHKCCSISIPWNIFILTFSSMFKFISMYFIGKKQLKFSQGVKKKHKTYLFSLNSLLQILWLLVSRRICVPTLDRNFHLPILLQWGCASCQPGCHLPPSCSWAELLISLGKCFADPSLLTEACMFRL